MLIGKPIQEGGSEAAQDVGVMAGTLSLAVGEVAQDSCWDGAECSSKRYGLVPPPVSEEPPTI